MKLRDILYEVTTTGAIAKAPARIVWGSKDWEKRVNVHGYKCIKPEDKCEEGKKFDFMVGNR